ncbi:MAG: O-antigen ligase family protein, partial [Eubacterium sp.]|nr:O-antigen ligase family protein [Eubacterium sp.]
MDIVNSIFLVYIVAFYPLYMHNKFFDITGTRAKVFEIGGLFYVLLFIMALILEIFMLRYYEPGAKILKIDTKIYALPEFWALLFFVANLIAFFISPDKKAAWLGTTGRYYGLCLMLIFLLVFLCLSYQTYIGKSVFVFLFLSASVSLGTAFLQHFGMDPFHLKVKVVDKQKELFISTFGNLNTYGSYLSIFIPVFAALFVFGMNVDADCQDDEEDGFISWLQKHFLALFSGIMLFCMGMAIIPAKSDNVYLGVGIAFIAMFYIAISNKRLTEYMFGLLLVVSGLLFMAVLNKVFDGSQRHINGIAEIVENPKIMFGLLLFVVFILIVCLIFRKTNYDKYKAFQSGKFLIVFSGLFVIAVIAAFAIGVKSGSSIFKFDYNWGTYRGYIWTKCWVLFKDSNLFNKIFGNGIECIARLMNQRFYEEMIDVTGKKYDNAHNELLQYLLTIGIFGFVSFIGMSVASFTYMWKRAKGNPVVIACLLGGIGYFGQCIVTLNQPITGPFYIVLLASGIGYIRYRESKKEYYKPLV